MYPRVKVRKQEDPKAIQEEATSFVIRVIESLSIEGHCSSRTAASDRGNECKDDLHSPQASISETNPKNSLDPSVSESKGNINKASSVLRPRAVLSSPDNDGIIGNQNLRRTTRTPMRRRTLNTDCITGQQKQPSKDRTLPKRQILGSNIQAPDKCGQVGVRVESPLRPRSVSKEASKSSHPNKTHSLSAPPRQRALIKRG